MRLRPRLALLAIGLAALAIVGLPSAARGYPLDDSWIYAVVARNVATHQGFGFTPGEPSSGATSAAWALLLSLNEASLHLSPPVFTAIVEGAAIVWLGQALFGAAVDDGLSDGRSFALAAIATMTGNFVWLAFIGMEPVVFCLSALLAVRAFFRPTERSALSAGALVGIAGMLRPEAFVCALALPLLRRSARRSWGEVQRALGVALAFLALDLALGYLLTGAPLPATLSGRRWLAELPDGAIAPPKRMLMYFVLRLAHFGLRVLPTARSPVPVLLAVTVVLAGAGAFGLFTLLRRSDAPRLRGLAVFSILHSIAFVVLFPVLGTGGRYQPVAILLSMPLVLLGAFRLQDRARAWERVAGRTIAAAAFVCAALSLFVWRDTLSEGIALVDETHRAMARHLREDVPHEDVVASFDIGAIGYESAHPIVDLGGLVDRDYLPFLWSGRVDEYLAEKRVRWVVLPEYYEERPTSDVPSFRVIGGLFSDATALGPKLGLGASGDIVLSKSMEVRFPKERWLPVGTLTTAALPRQVLYRVAPKGDSR